MDNDAVSTRPRRTSSGWEAPLHPAGRCSGSPFFTRALRTLKVNPVEVVNDAAPVYPGVLDELLPAAWHHVEQYAKNPIEADHASSNAS